MYVLTLIQKMIWVEVSTGTFLETTLTVGTSQNIPEIEVFFIHVIFNDNTVLIFS